MSKERTLPFVIGISGRMKSGKDQVATYLTEDMNKTPYQSKVVKYAFADPLKRGLIDIFGLKEEDVYTQEGKAAFNEKWGMTNRKILQRFGTNAVRNHLHPLAWIFAMDNFLMKQDPNSVVLIPDVRFENEADLIIYKYDGIIIYVERPELVSPWLRFKEMFGLVHPSEQPINRLLRTFSIVNDGDLGYLKNCVHKVWMDIAPELPMF